MANGSKSDQPQICEQALRNFSLLALPFLNYQRQILDLAKKSIKDASSIRPTENLVITQLQAMMMILDRSRTWRNLADHNLEKKAENAYKELFPKLASASVQFLEAQEIVVTSLFDSLVVLKDGGKAKERSKSRR